ncbi:radical SAM protein [Candidatus Poribacteria bacterium]|nr:radical SAM protein [Candidatus Poribacteria bacterium]
MIDYLKVVKQEDMPRIPTRVDIDITYRCNNNCRHCWLRIPPGDPKRREELTLEEIKNLVDDCRGLGARTWSISGGEPMLRPDFADIMEYMASKSISVGLNTNGTLISPKYAELLKNIKGTRMIALYGATPEICDKITRNHGSFESTMQGFAYMKEAGADFTVQVIPLKSNYHQFDEMVELAKSLSNKWRIGAPWLYLSTGVHPERNEDIKNERLDPKTVIELSKPDVNYEEWMKEEGISGCGYHEGDDRVFAKCVSARRDFHIDPYGQMSFCSFIKDPELRYDIREGSVQEGWDEFIPSISDKARAGQEYLENCGSCEHKTQCKWCSVYSYLEHGNYSSKVEYLCEVTKESLKYREEWKKLHRRYYQIGGMSLQIDSEIPFDEYTYSPKFKNFRIDGPLDDNITMYHQFSIPPYKDKNLGKEVYRLLPWVVYKKGKSWIYECISGVPGDDRTYQLAVFSEDYRRGRIFSPDGNKFKTGGLNNITLYTNDQILISLLLADRQGCIVHSSGVKLDNGNGFIFLGQSNAGKSTMARLLSKEGKVLCDDRMIIRKWPDGFKIHGTWNHGEIPDVYPDSAPLKAIMFLEQARENTLVPLDNKREILSRLLPRVAKPVATAQWWEKVLNLVEDIINEVPIYIVRFDKSGDILQVLKEL